MKHFYLILVVVSLFAFVLLTGYGAGPASFANNHFIGAPGGSTATCGTCHGSPGSFGVVTAGLQVFNVGTTIPAIGYVAGSTYDIEVEIMHPIGSPGRFGFQLVGFDSGGAQAGTFTNPMAGTSILNLASGTTVVEHSSFNASPVFRVQWIAPSTATGTVTFYAGGVAANGTGTNAGDGGSTAPVSLNLPPDSNVPIELMDFNARQIDNSISLEWITLSEEENSHFEIQHADESGEFKAIAKIDGAGTSTETVHYRFQHETPAYGTNHYYRLKQVNFNGVYTFSEILTIYMKGNIDQITVYPIPATDQVTVLVNAKKTATYNQMVTDLNGKIVMEDIVDLTAGEQSIKLDIQELTGGQYIFILTNGKDKLSTPIIKF